MKNIQGKFNKNYLEIVSYTFDYTTQHIFSKFSGDINPVHIDSHTAKKTNYGDCIVHGINLFLWAVENFSKQTKIKVRSFDIEFKTPVFVNTEVKLLWHKPIDQLLIVSAKEDILVSIFFEKKKDNYQVKDIPLDNLNSLISPMKKRISSMSRGKKIINRYGGNKKLAYKLYPYLCENLGINKVYEIGILSNIVGMQLPGLNSILASCKISFNITSSPSPPQYKLENYDSRFNLLNIFYEGKNINSEVTAFERPCYIPKTCLEIKPMIPKLKIFEGKKILVIGGSRGIGAAFARVSSLLGANITITYHTSKNEAKNVCNDIQKNSKLPAKSFALDANSRKSVELIKNNYDYLCYFPSNKIFGKIGDRWDLKRFEGFYNIYCKAFEDIAQKFIKNGGNKIYYPSSVVVEQDIKGLEEYKLAKIIGEKICESLNQRFNSIIIIDRLDRVETDQTLSVLKIPSVDAVQVAYNISKKLCGS